LKLPKAFLIPTFMTKPSRNWRNEAVVTPD
jgi:hypothetical protein